MYFTSEFTIIRNDNHCIVIYVFNENVTIKDTWEGVSDGNEIISRTNVMKIYTVLFQAIHRCTGWQKFTYTKTANLDLKANIKVDLWSKYTVGHENSCTPKDLLV